MLELRSLGKRYPGGTVALADFTLQQGEGVLGLLGPNGAGKTTLMSILATVTRPTAGTFLWEGRDGVADPLSVRRVLGYLPQDFGVYERLTAREFLRYLGRLKGLGGKALEGRIGELLELVNLHGAADRRLGAYSGGMRQRVGIAQALLGDPKLVIVDEPTVGLDPEERVRFRNLLSEIASGRLVILSTHIVSDVEAVASRIAVIHGRDAGRRWPRPRSCCAGRRAGCSRRWCRRGGRRGAAAGQGVRARPARRRRPRPLRGRAGRRSPARGRPSRRSKTPIWSPSPGSHEGRGRTARGAARRRGEDAAPLALHPDRAAPALCRLLSVDPGADRPRRVDHLAHAGGSPAIERIQRRLRRRRPGDARRRLPRARRLLPRRRLRPPRPRARHRRHPRRHADVEPRLPRRQSAGPRRLPRGGRADDAPGRPAALRTVRQRPVRSDGVPRPVRRHRPAGDRSCRRPGGPLRRHPGAVGASADWSSGSWRR